MAIFEPTVTKEILGVTCNILRKNFYYDDSDMVRFVRIFTERISRELSNFEVLGSPAVIRELRSDSVARLYFTCYFVSAHLRDIFIHDMHFSEQELSAFDSILPKYAGENHFENKQGYKRAHYRKFPK